METVPGALSVATAAESGAAAQASAEVAAAMAAVMAALITEPMVQTQGPVAGDVAMSSFRACRLRAKAANLARMPQEMSAEIVKK
jgi:hypothetical protein